MTQSKRLAGVPPVPSFAGRNGTTGSIHVGTGNGDRRGDKEPLAAGSLHNFKASVARRAIVRLPNKTLGGWQLIGKSYGSLVP
jgi:hypothetical protein